MGIGSLWHYHSSGMKLPLSFFSSRCSLFCCVWEDPCWKHVFPFLEQPTSALNPTLPLLMTSSEFHIPFQHFPTLQGLYEKHVENQLVSVTQPRAKPQCYIFSLFLFLFLLLYAQPLHSGVNVQTSPLISVCSACMVSGSSIAKAETGADSSTRLHTATGLFTHR